MIPGARRVPQKVPENTEPRPGTGAALVCSMTSSVTMLDSSDHIPEYIRQTWIFGNKNGV